MKALHRPSAPLLALLLLLVGAGCARDGSDSPLDPSISSPSHVPNLGHDPIPPGVLPGSDDEWFAVVDPSIVDLAQIQRNLRISVIGVDDYDNVSVVLFDDNGRGLGAGDYDQPGIIVGFPNDPVDIAEGGSLVIGFIGGDWTAGGIRPQPALASLNVEGALAHATGAGVHVGIVDTGARLTHWAYRTRLVPLLNHRLNSAEAVPDRIDNDGDGLVDEGFGHGTHQTGNIAATMAPGCTITPVSVLNDEGQGSLLAVVEGILALADMDVDIINLSLVLSAQSAEFDSLLSFVQQEKGIPFVSAAGNRAETPGYYPAISTQSNVIGVTAVDPADVRASFSCWGPAIDFAAPGVGVVSTGPTGDNSMSVGSGTSMATSITTGAIALVMDKFDCSAMQAIALMETAPVTPTDTCVEGRVNPYATVLGPSSP